MITAYHTQRELSSEQAEAREWLDELAVREDDRYWPELLETAAATAHELRDPEHWPDGQTLALGGGAYLRQTTQRWAGSETVEDRLALEIEIGGLTWTLTTVAILYAERDEYLVYRSWTEYARNVRDLRRTLRARRRALDNAFHAALRTLPAEVEERLGRAYGLALAGAVELIDASQATVASESQPARRYEINGRCECQDAEHRAPSVNGRPACKHQLAVWLVRRAGEVGR